MSLFLNWQQISWLWVYFFFKYTEFTRQGIKKTPFALYHLNSNGLISNIYSSAFVISKINYKLWFDPVSLCLETALRMCIVYSYGYN